MMKLLRTFCMQNCPPAVPAKPIVPASQLWRKMALLGAFPVVGLLMLNSYIQLRNGRDVPTEYVPYEYLIIHTKRYPWGDGGKSAFHNPKVNRLPPGYEE